MIELNSLNPRLKFGMADLFSEGTLSKIDGILAFIHGGFSPMHDSKVAAQQAGLLTMPHVIYGELHSPVITRTNQPQFIIDGLNELVSKGCTKIAFHGGSVRGITYVEGARLCLRTILEWLDSHKEWPGEVVMVDIGNDYFNKFAHMLPWEDDMMKRDISFVALNDFECFMESQFNGCVNEWFMPETGIDFRYGPLVAMSRKCGDCSANIFFNKLYLSVGVFYACLIPQIVAKITGRMDGLYSACRCSGWPAFTCGLGGIMHPSVVLKDAELYPQGEDVEKWAELAEAELEYFRKYTYDLLGGDIWAWPEGVQLTLTKQTEGKIAAVCDEIGHQIRLMTEALRTGGPVDNYLINEVTLTSGGE